VSFRCEGTNNTQNTKFINNGNTAPNYVSFLGESVAWISQTAVTTMFSLFSDLFFFFGKNSTSRTDVMLRLQGNKTTMHLIYQNTWTTHGRRLIYTCPTLVEFTHTHTVFMFYRDFDFHTNCIGYYILYTYPCLSPKVQSTLMYPIGLIIGPQSICSQALKGTYMYPLSKNSSVKLTLLCSSVLKLKS